MASIFFTERLLGTSHFGLQGCFYIARGAQMFDRFFLACGHAHIHRLPVSTMIWNWLPQKQGLCQVVNMPDFDALSGF
jgi:hypothetical protein